MPRAPKAEPAGNGRAVAAVRSDGAEATEVTPKDTRTAKAAPPPAKTSKEASTTPAKAHKTSKTTAVHDESEGPHEEFLGEQRLQLLSEREDYVQKAEELKAEADSLARETEPGDIQFDEEGGEGGTASIDREVDLVLSAQARAAVEEIDRSLHKMELGTYGVCEGCGQAIPRARLQALPYAALCVQCKSGGLSRR
jgi:DnaK suppressor protein